MSGGANRDSLMKAQLTLLEAYPIEVQAARNFVRSHKWRPLRSSDLKDSAAPTSGTEYFHTACEDAVPYYWER